MFIEPFQCPLPGKIGGRFVLGYSHRMYEKTGDRQLSAWEAGILTRRYGLDKEMVMDFFRENNSCSTLRFFMAGYRLEN
ncbi:DUF2623 family protein [Escherichia coli]